MPAAHWRRAAQTKNAWRSFSARSLLGTAGNGVSMRGGTRAADFFCSVIAASLRACLRSRPCATSRASQRRARAQPMPCHVQAPNRSMMVSHDTPKASDRPPIPGREQEERRAQIPHTRHQVLRDYRADDAARG